MEILYITQTLPPEPGSTQRPLRQAISLTQLGHQVTLLTTMPNYPTGKIFEDYRGKVYLREYLEGIEVIRIFSIPSANQGVVLRTLSAISFALVMAIAATLLRRRDLIIASVPMIGTELTGIVAAKVKRTSCLLELRDMMPEALAISGLLNANSKIMYLLRKYYDWVYEKVDFIAVTGESMKAVLKDRRVLQDKILLWPHAADFDQLNQFDRGSSRERLGAEKFFTIVYTGSFSRYYNIHFIIDAAIILAEQYPSILFLLVGDGPDRSRVQKIIEERKCQNIRLCEPVAPKEVGFFLHASDLLLAPYCVLDPSQASYLVDYPTTKLCEYLAVGRPIIAIENVDVYGPLLKRVNAGIQIRPDNSRDLASAIVDFSRDPDKCARYGESGRNYATLYLSRMAITKNFNRQLTNTIQSLINH
jgi:colanic acid biosynthesis glycosyl transferase WcaI